MVIETNLSLIFWDTLGGVIKNLPFFILIIWGVKVLSKSISNGMKTIIKQMPDWISEYDNMKMKHYKIEQAIAGRTR